MTSFCGVCPILHRIKNAAMARTVPKISLRYSASSLTDSLRSVVRLRRAGKACPGMEATLSTDSGRSGRRTCAQEERPGERIPALPVFHRLRPPDKHHRIGRSNQWWRNPTGLKDTRRFPWWLLVRSCSCLSVYRCHSAVMAAFVSFHA